MGGLRNVYAAFACISFSGALYGFLVGIIGTAASRGQLACGASDGRVEGSLLSLGYGQCYGLSVCSQNLLSCASLAGALVSSLLCYCFAGRLGRKRELQIGGSCYFIGALLAGLSPVLFGVYAGLAIYGAGAGFCAYAAPIYLAEIAPPHLRGRLVVSKETMVVLGILVGYLSGTLAAQEEQRGWRMMPLVASGFSMLFLAALAPLRRSPRWLLHMGLRKGGLLGLQDHHVREAIGALQFYRQARTDDEKEAVEKEVRSLQEEMRPLDAGTRRRARLSEAFGHPRLLAVGCGLMFLQQTLGQPSVLFLSMHIFKDAGFGPVVAPATIIGAMLVASVFAACAVERVGRRRLLLSGGAITAAALVLLVLIALVGRCEVAYVSFEGCRHPVRSGQPGAWALAAVAALTLCAVGHSVGLGAVSWLVNVEIYPLSVRGSMLSVAAVVGFGSDLVTTMMHGDVFRGALTPASILVGYLVMSVASTALVWAYVPEGKGKSLEELEHELTIKEEPSAWPAPRSRVGSQNSQGEEQQC